MLRTKKLYSKVRGLYEYYGEGSFTEFLHELCDISVISVHQAAKLRKLEAKYTPPKATISAEFVNDIAFDIMHADNPEVSFRLAKELYDFTI